MGQPIILNKNSFIPFLAILVPFIGSFVSYYIQRKKGDKIAGITASAITGFSFLLILTLLPDILNGVEITYSLKGLPTLYVFEFYVDPFSYLFAFITTLIWFLGTIYSINFMQGRSKVDRFYLFSLLTLAANLGVVISGDLFLIYVFFELLAVFSLIMIVNEGTPEAFNAGKLYFYIGTFCGLSLLAGILIYFIETGVLTYNFNLETLEELGNLRYLIAALMVIGFGGKAGLFPFHVWMPNGYENAPLPVCALSSGAMIKAGAYGIFRTLTRMFSPEEFLKVTQEAIHSWILPEIGFWVIWTAIITAFMGWVLALLQDDMKRLLAYSSISQIGYILLGIGTASYLGYKGALGFAGALYHIFNHAIFKTCLFLVAGAIYYRTGTFDLKKIGGLWRDMPYTMVIAVVAAAGITGIPLFNGCISKTLIHHSITEAFHYGSSFPLHIAEILFIIIGGGTIAYYLKFIGLAFFGERQHKNIKKAPKTMLIPMMVLSGIVILAGFFPDLLMDSIILPSLSMHAISSNQIGHLAHINFFSITNIVSILTSIIIGVMLFVFSYYYGLIYKKWPKKLGMTFIYKKISDGFRWICEKPIMRIDILISNLFIKTSKDFIKYYTNPPITQKDQPQEIYSKRAKDFLKRTQKPGKSGEGIEEGYREEYEKILENLEEAEEEAISAEEQLHKLNKEFLSRNPVQFSMIIVSLIFNSILNMFFQIFLYPYVFFKRVYQATVYGPQNIKWSVRQEVKRIYKQRIYKRDISLMPRLGTIGFALFLVALVLALYLLYELISMF